MTKVYSLDDEYFAYDELSALINDAEIDEGTTVWVGDSRPVENSHLFDADDLIEMLADRMYGQVGECSEGWPHIAWEDKENLNAELSGIINRYFPHNFYKVYNVHEYVITEEDIKNAS